MKKKSKSSGSATSPRPSGKSGGPSSSEKPVVDATSPISNEQPDVLLKLETLLEALGAVWMQTARSLRDAGQIVCQIVDMCENGLQVIQQRYPDISRNTLARLEAVGRGRLLPELALDPSYGAGRLSVLSIEQQRHWAGRQLSVVKRGPEGETMVELKSVQQLSVSEANRVIASDHVRSESEQLALVTAPVRIVPRYRFDGEEIVFNENSRFTVVQLEALLQVLKRKQLARVEQEIV